MRVLGVAVWRWLLLVAARVLRAPEGPAAREARRPHVVRRRASKPARALRSLRRPPHQWGRVADVLLGALLEARPGPAGLAAASNRSGACVLPGQAPPPPAGTAASPSGPFDVCCYKRRQSEVFFVWIFDPLLQTSSIRRLFG